MSGKKEKPVSIAKLAQDRDGYYKSFLKESKAYQDLVADQGKRLSDFTTALSDELSTSREMLSKVAALAPGDASSAPVMRAAYSDRMSAIMAKLSMLAYIEFEDSAKRTILDDNLKLGGFKLLNWYKTGDTEAYLCEADRFLVVSFRGTTSKVDQKTDAQFRLSASLVEGHTNEVKVHRGFKEAFDLVGGQIHADLMKTTPGKPIYLTGHSLGGALAQVAAAAYSGRDDMGARIAAVYTFGAPRVGQKSYAQVVKAPHHRVVNQYDLVPQVPPTWIGGYRHTGDALVLERNKSYPVRRARGGGGAYLLAFFSLFLWPFSRSLMFVDVHDIALYCARLDAIAHTRGAWS